MIVDIIIENGLIITVDPERRILSDGAIAILGDTIVDIGKTNQIRKEYTAEKIIDARNKVVSPGLINSHTHITAEHLSRAFMPFNLTVDEWMGMVMPLNAETNAEDEYISSKLAFIECIKTGTTCFFDGGTAKHVGSVVEAMKETGIRGAISQWVWDIPEPKALYSSTEEGLEITENIISKYHGLYNGRVQTSASTIIGTIGASTELLVGLKEIADKHNLMMNFHSGSGPVDDFVKQSGKRPCKYYEDLEILDKNTRIVHMWFVDDDEIDIVSKQGVHVAFCPPSALRAGLYAVNVGKYPEMLAKGVNVCFGTDGANSSNYYDMVRCAYLGAGLYSIPVETALEMSTINGAKSMGLEDQIGSLEKGKKADIILFDRNRPEWNPLFNVVNSLVTAATGSSVDTVLIDGKIIMENYELKMIDEYAVYKEVQKRGEAMIKRTGLPLKVRWKTT